VSENTPAGANGPLFVTGDSVDPVLARPYVDETRPGSTTDPATGVTVGYTYVHGGFEGTNARFALYLPDRADYAGRFFQWTYPTVGEEAGRPENIVMAIRNGAYLVSSNNGGGVVVAGELGGYRVNAAAAKYSRVVASEYYGTSERPRGYLFGGSGGAFQTLGAMRGTTGVWDGSVPMVPGVPGAMPSFASVLLLGLRVLADRLPAIVDAVAPGGSGDPYTGLDEEQAAALRETTAMGFPVQAWWRHEGMNLVDPFGQTMPLYRAFDAGYAEDFWNDPAYEGSRPLVRAARVQHATTVADLVVTSGAAAGQVLQIGEVVGATLTFGPSADAAVAAQLQPGDAVVVDNSWSIALGYYQRHLVPDTTDLIGWNQYRDASGAPIPPQRANAAMITGFIQTLACGGVPLDGHFDGRMIMLAATMDIQAYPWSADWYRQLLVAATGADIDDRYRLWYVEHGDHDPIGPAWVGLPDAAAHIVPYLSVVEQALLDLDAWVLAGTPPPPNSRYTIGADSQVHLAPTAAARGSVQPLVWLSVGDGSPATTVAVDEPVTFTVDAEVPTGTGKIVAVEWDFEGTAEFVADPAAIAAAPTLHGPHLYDAGYTPRSRARHRAPPRRRDRRLPRPGAEHRPGARRRSLGRGGCRVGDDQRIGHRDATGRNGAIAGEQRRQCFGLVRAGDEPQDVPRRCQRGVRERHPPTALVLMSGDAHTPVGDGEQRITRHERGRVAVGAEAEVHEVEGPRQPVPVVLRGAPQIRSLHRHRDDAGAEAVDGRVQVGEVAVGVVRGNDPLVHLVERDAVPRQVGDTQVGPHPPRGAPATHRERERAVSRDRIAAVLGNDSGRGLGDSLRIGEHPQPLAHGVCGFSACPPNWLRIADSTLPVKVPRPRDSKRSLSAAPSTLAGTPSSMAAIIVQRPSPESDTRPVNSSSRGDLASAAAVRSTSHELTTEPRRHSSATSATSISYW
jgi:hypothetical protein